MNQLTNLVMNGVAKKELANKCKKELEKTRREQEIALDRVALLEEKTSELEAMNTQLSKMNVSLSEINEQLTDECFVKDRRIESLNETLAQVQQDTAKYKEEAEQKKQENVFLSLELSEWVDEEGKLLARIKEGISDHFCKSEEGKNNSGQKDDNIDDKEAPSPKGGSQEEPTEESQEDQNQNTLNQMTTKSNKGAYRK
ncbi:hypothetical protein M9H77_13021 [Catharanthus roseus]|uniref:Uncharacterized protein n=1 Tax=Catharanthus roseus TaxID=4058 RepID=A0ACC0BJ90_CATRO|nr:hypothetical protein M9H77_13021 [Catharanthus roseus]